MAKKIVVLDGYTANPGDLSWEELEKLGELTVYDRTPSDKIIERIGDASYVFTNKTPLSKETIEQSSNLEFIGVLATGYNIVDIEAAKEKTIPVCNIPSYSTDSVAQFVFALLLEICHHVGHHSHEVKKGRWTSCNDFSFWDYPLIELSGKTIGFIGFGEIGQATAKIARSFGLHTIAYNRSQSDEGAKLAEYVSLDELLETADIISLHLPLFPETKNLINAKTIDQMKDGVVVINTARGPLVNETEMAKALEEGKVGYYAADVTEIEPIPGDNPLLKAPNAIITPHIAWAPKEARQRLINLAVRNLKLFQTGNTVNVVNL